MEHTSTEKRDFGVGSVSAAILRLAIPMTFAQLINVLYSVVDRIYIGHLPHTSTEALTLLLICSGWAELLFFPWKEDGKILTRPGRSWEILLP